MTFAAGDNPTPTLEDTLAWLKKMPTMSRSAIGPKAELDCFHKLTVADLSTLKELHLGGHVVKEGKLQPGHVEFPADDYRYLTALETLDLRATQVTDAGLAKLQVLPKLQELKLGNTAITDQRFVSLQSIRSLKRVNVHNCPNISTKDLAELKKALPDCPISQQPGP